jgi:hypothetical protein
MNSNHLQHPGIIPSYWEKEQTEKTVQTLYGTCEYSSYDDTYEQQAKYEITQNLANEILRRDLVMFEKIQNTYGSLTLRGMISVAPPDIQKVSVQRDIFVLNNISFSQTQVKKAILNTYPEYFL